MRQYIVSLLLALGTLQACSCEKVPAGNVGIKVYLLGSEKGVDHEVLGVGRYTIGLNEDLYLFPTFEQNPKYTKAVEDDAGREVEFQDKDGLAMDADFSVTYTITRENAAKVFQKYRAGIEEINRNPLRNILRDAVNAESRKMPVEAIYGAGNEEMLARIQARVTEEAEKSGITVTNVSLLGVMRLPPQVTGALNAKIEATQRAQQRENELRESEAMAKKVAAEAEGKAAALLTEAKAQAQANQILSESLTTNLVEYKRVEKWDGKLPTVQGAGASFLQLPGQPVK